MPEPQSGGQSDTMQVYSPSGKSITIKRSALGAAQKNGWLLNAPSKVDGAGQGGQGQQPFGNPGFWDNFGKGINPFHMTPENTPTKTGPGFMGGMARFGEDLANLREIHAMRESGNVKGATGMAAGTLASFAGPEIIKAGGKALKEGGEAIRAAKEIPMVARVAKRAKETAAALGGGIDASRFAERYVAPLRDALDAKFQPIHDALSGKPIALTNIARQQILRMSRSELAPVKKLGKELLKRSALDYQEARDLSEKTIPTLVRQLKKMGGDHWIQEAHALSDEVEKGIDGLAHQNGVKAVRDSVKAAYKEVKDLTASVVATAKQKPSGLKRAATAVAGFGAGLAVGHPIAGEIAAIHGFENKGMRLTEEAVVKGIELAKKLGVDYREMIGAVRTGGEKAGTYLERLYKLTRALQATGGAARGASNGPSQ
jgi:hypothetical protein